MAEQGLSRSTRVALGKRLESQAAASWGQLAELPKPCTGETRWQQTSSELSKEMLLSCSFFFVLAKVKMAN